jgi:anti-sigma-K factor RskA
MQKDSKNIREELQNRSPLLAELQSKYSGQKVPDGYFDQLESELLRKIEENDYPKAATTAGKTPVWRSMSAVRGTRFAMAAAAVFVLVFAAWWFFRIQPGQPAVPHNYRELAANLTAEDAAAYVESNIHEFETTTLANYAAVEPTAAPKSASERTAKRALSLEELSEEQLDLLLQDLSDEELEEIL